MDDKRLKLTVKKRIETTMIGAIASIEKQFEDNMNDPQFEQVFAQLRQEILDKGNNQIRALDGDFDSYEITKKKYHYKFPIRRT
jgi:hypothetical protein